MHRHPSAARRVKHGCGSRPATCLPHESEVSHVPRHKAHHGLVGYTSSWSNMIASRDRRERPRCSWKMGADGEDVSIGSAPGESSQRTDSRRGSSMHDVVPSDGCCRVLRFQRASNAGGARCQGMALEFCAWRGRGDVDGCV